MINDKTIDAPNAKYWCIFLDKDIAKLLDQAQQYNKKDGQRLVKTLSMAKNSEKTKTVDEGMWDFVQAAHSAAFPLAGGNPFQPNFRCMDPASGVLSLQDQGKNNVIAVTTAAALVGASATPGGWAAIASAFGAAGSWLVSLIPAAETGFSLVTAGVMAIAGGIVSVSSYLYPRIAKLIQDLRRNGVLARCEFEADGTPYKAVFSASAKRWELLYNNNRWIRSGTKVPPQDIANFFDSQFFEKFLNQCKKNISKVYDDPEKMKQLDVLSKMADKKSAEDVKFLIDAKDIVYEYMFKGQYITERDNKDL